MSWRDRDYNQNGYGGSGNPILAILFSSVPLGRWFGIRVRVHATFIFFVLFVILLDPNRAFTWRWRLESMGALFVIVLLHEFGHCFAARWVGGTAEDIVMWPLGGLAYAQPPHRWLPTLITVAGGPLVNVAICFLTAAALFLGAHVRVSLNPFNLLPSGIPSAAWGWVWWTFVTSYILLLFNLLPIFPLDGGQLLQAALWPRMGHYRSMMFACKTGMIGAVALGAFGLLRGFDLLMIFIAINGFMICYQQRMALLEMGPEWGEEDSPLDFSASLREEPSSRKRLSRRAIRKAQKIAAREQAEQARIDAILAKVSAHGMNSLTWLERRALRKATEHQRQRDLELSRRED